MAKNKYVTIGSLLKNKEGSRDTYYFKINPQVGLGIGADDLDVKYFRVVPNESGPDYVKFDLLNNEEKVGSILKAKDSENGLYFKVNKDLELFIDGQKSPATIDMRKPQEKYEFWATKGIITEEEAEEKMSKIPDFVRYEFVAKLVNEAL